MNRVPLLVGLLLVVLGLAGSAAAEVPAFTECKGALEPSVKGGCGTVKNVGCCDVTGRNLWCQNGHLYCLDCTDGFDACGFNPLGYYDCGQPAGVSDPAGVHVISCAPCPAECGGSAVCSETCAGLCGTCQAGQKCLDSGVCYAPECGLKECGKDANGFSCGTCTDPEVCVEELGACQAPPTGCSPKIAPGCDGCECQSCVCAKYPTCCTDHWDVFCATACTEECGMDCSPCAAGGTCEGVECGNYCGSDCGSCGAGAVCLDNHCCAQQCAGKQCGTDGCGGVCGSCAPFDECVDGQCVVCVPQCAGADCGSDGCGGTCGTCAPGDTCADGTCVECVPDCEGKQCGDDGCGGECGPCIQGQDCIAAQCHGCGVVSFVGCCDEQVSRWCQSGGLHTEDCVDGGCGWDSANGYYDCGFSGQDPSGQHPQDCYNCVPTCSGRACGGDGCGGTCGACGGGLTCAEGQCVSDTECGGLTEVGCCSGDSVRFCSGGVTSSFECKGGGCGWSTSGPMLGWYDCGGLGADPSGAAPHFCPACTPDCGGKTCGNDGCGGSCGTCDGGTQCLYGKCVVQAAPDTGGPAPTPDTAAPEPDAMTPPAEPVVEADASSGSGDCGGCRTPGDAPARPGAGWPLVLILVAGMLVTMRRGATSPWLALALPAALWLLVVVGCAEERRQGPHLVQTDKGPAATADAAPDGAEPVDVPIDVPATVDVAEDVPGPPPTDVPVVPDLPDPEPPPPPDVPDVPDAGPELPPPVDTGPPPPDFDCDSVPSGPFFLSKLDGPIASEDLAFDTQGNVVAGNDKAIFKSAYNEPPKVFVPNMKFRAGMRFLPNGHLVVCDNVKGELVRIDPSGVKYTLMSGLSYPNGLTVDMKGWVYFTEHDANVVWRVHPFTGEATVLTTQISNPNGLAFSPDYKTLYIDGFNGNPIIYSMSISADGVPGKLVHWTSVGTGWHDGMGVDICGNVYVADYNQTVIYRISPDGQNKELLIDGKSFSNAYLPNLQWGSGIGGWDPLSIYMPDGWNKGVFEVKIGVPGAPTPYP